MHDRGRRPLADLWSLAGRTAVVTGGGNGIGRATALRLFDLGSAVAIVDRDPEAAGAVAREIEGEGGRAIAIAADVAEPGAGERIADAACSGLDRIHVLVNAAGIYPHTPLLDLDLEEWDRILRVNLRGAFDVSRACARRMLEGTGGVIVNVASRAAARPSSGLAAYAASKAGLVSLTKSLALELAPRIRVNAVAPGAISDTATARRMQQTAVAKGADPQQLIAEMERRIGSKVPLGRTGKADEVARVIAFLAADVSSYVDGSVVAVDGGDPIV